MRAFSLGAGASSTVATLDDNVVRELVAGQGRLGNDLRDTARHTREGTARFQREWRSTRRSFRQVCRYARASEAKPGLRWTPANHLRHSKFIALREDKDQNRSHGNGQRGMIEIFENSEGSAVQKYEVGSYLPDPLHDYHSLFDPKI